MDLRETVQGALTGTHEIERELGGGGMSRVYIARDTALDRRVVIKILPPEMAGGVSIERFKREIAVSAGLQHPHIVPVFSAGEAAGLPYFTMPFVEGESLRQRLTHGELPVADAIRLMRDVANALAYAHAHGVVHRDIKPDNILLTGRTATVTDFGVAKALSAAGARAAVGTLTDVGMALGTPAYMAPEQATADPSADHRADIYAFGIVAYEMLTGQTPFAGRNGQQLLAAQVTEAPRPVEQLRPAIPPALAALVMRCLEKRPADRPQSADEVLVALDAIATPASGGVQPTTARPAVGRTRALRLAVGVAAALLIVAATVAYRVTRGEAAPSRTRLAVAPFANTTGDSSLDVIGVMAADWVTRGLAQLDSLEVVSASAALAAHRDIDAQPSTDVVQEFARRTRAGRVISGRYLRSGSSLSMQVEIVDARTGAVEQSLPPISIDPASPEAGIEEVQQRVMGAIATREDRSRRIAGRPPKYEAYRAVVDAWADWENAPRSNAALRRAIELDSSFILAHVLAATQLANASNWRGVDSVLRAIEPMVKNEAPEVKNQVERIRCLVAGDLECGLRFARQFAQRDSTWEALYEVGRAAMITNRHAESAAACERLREEEIRRTWYQPFRNCAFSYHALGEHTEELDVLRRGLTHVPGAPNLLYQQFRALAAIGGTERIDALLDSVYGAWTPDQPVAPYVHLIHIQAELRAHGRESAADLYAERALAWAASRPVEEQVARPGRKVWLARALMETNRADSAYALIASVPPPRPALPGTVADSTNLEYLAYFGIAAARAGRTAVADSILALLAADTRPFTRGKPAYARARILAEQGKTDAAIAELKKAYRLGYRWTMEIHVEPAFAKLRKMPAFQDVVRPKS